MPSASLAGCLWATPPIRHRASRGFAAAANSDQRRGLAVPLRLRVRAGLLRLANLKSSHVRVTVAGNPACEPEHLTHEPGPANPYRRGRTGSRPARTRVRRRWTVTRALQWRILAALNSGYSIVKKMQLQHSFSRMQLQCSGCIADANAVLHGQDTIVVLNCQDAIPVVHRQDANAVFNSSYRLPGCNCSTQLPGCNCSTQFQGCTIAELNSTVRPRVLNSGVLPGVDGNGPPTGGRPLVALRGLPT